MSRLLYDSKRNLVKLGEQIGKGGEGIVYELKNNTNFVAKLYKKSLEHTQKKKLKAMISMMGLTELRKTTSWPLDTLHISSDSSVDSICGLIMDRVNDSHEIHELYTPNDREQHFPNSGWSFMISTARNLSASVECLHKHNCVVGDLNESNIFVSSKAIVRLIDCDSYQIQDSGNIYTCDVGVGQYNAPELQGKPFKSLVRNKEADYFTLAVFIFKLLFMGRHPFSGKYIGSGPPKSIESLIKEKLYFYGERAIKNQIVPPPNMLDIKCVPPLIKEYFERAFTTKDMRPSASDWITALNELNNSIKQCSSSRAHQFYKNASTCPWCKQNPSPNSNKLFNNYPDNPSESMLLKSIDKIERLSLPNKGVYIHSIKEPDFHINFRPPIKEPRNLSADLTQLIDLFQKSKSYRLGEMLGNCAKKMLIPTFIFLVLTVWAFGIFDHNPEFSEIRLAFLIVTPIAAILTCSFLKEWMHNLPQNIKEHLAKDHSEKTESLLSLQSEQKSLHSQLRFTYDNYIRFCKNNDIDLNAHVMAARFKAEKVKLRAIYNSITSFDKQCSIEITSAKKHQKHQSLNSHLMKFKVDEHEIPGIPLRIKNSLRHHGVIDASHVDRNTILSIPQFGHVRCEYMMDWKMLHEKSYVYSETESNRRDLDRVKEGHRKAKNKLIYEFYKAEREILNIIQTCQTKQNDYASLIKAKQQKYSDITKELYINLHQVAQCEADIKSFERLL